MLLLSLLAFAATGFAQSCQPDVLVDDFRARTPSMYRQQPLTLIEGGVPVATGCEFGTGFNGCNKTLNLLGGDFGDSGIDEVLNVGSLTLTPKDNSAVVGGFEAAARPGTAVTLNYWFIKFNWENDFDLTKYVGLLLDFTAPVGADMNITLTQWEPVSNTRGIDSQYRLLSSYIKPNGQPQTLNLKWTDYSTNLNNQPFDLKHLKDITFVNLSVNSTFVFTKMTLTGNCTTKNTVVTTSGVPATTKTSGSVASAHFALAGAVIVSIGLLF
ncbi:UNVERIFIED_CONTAM: hypothetical protein HDU68_009954 [Siphonaria sp. JEL0065]|nr:hypothetical protein HDU68_009954 [Siphonaria sp. JEL0065]